MDRSRTVVAASLGLCLLSRVEYDSAFVAAGSLRAAAALRSHTAGTSARQKVTTGSFGAAAAAAALGVAGLAASSRRARARVQVRADASGLVASGPIASYTKALMDAAEKKGEAVAVTKDVLAIRDKFNDDAFLDELKLIVNEPGQSQLAVGKQMAELLKPLESSVMEKFIVFLAKKRRLMALKGICKEYVAIMYFNQSIAPVVVRSAQKLTDEQMNTIKEKMKVRAGVADIKLINKLDANLMAGFTVEWGYPDPTNLESPSSGIDLSLKSVLETAAIDKGVPMTI